ncbi:hypothetical protein [Methanosarcina sp. WWM596]|nr:hypothetical protein [Methanosarcina sp. WWM596]
MSHNILELLCSPRVPVFSSGQKVICSYSAAFAIMQFLRYAELEIWH